MTTPPDPASADRSAEPPPAVAPPPGAGALAAETVMLAATLCASLARSAAGIWPEADGVAAQAMHLSSRAEQAREANVDAYAAARRQLGISAGSDSGRDGMLAAVLLASADTLLGVAAAAADAAALAAEIAAQLRPDLRPDALGAAEIAAGAAAAASELVQVNLALGPEDPRRERGARCRTEARDSVTRARAALLN